MNNRYIGNWKDIEEKQRNRRKCSFIWRSSIERGLPLRQKKKVKEPYSQTFHDNKLSKDKSVKI